MNAIQRKCGSLALGSTVNLSVFVPSIQVALASATVSVDLLKKGASGPAVTIDCVELTQDFKEQFLNQVFNAKQQLAMEFSGIKLDLIIDKFEHASIGLDSAKPESNGSSLSRGQILQGTEIIWSKTPGSKSTIVLKGTRGAGRNDSLFKNDFNFEQMGIGGLGQEFQTIFRRAFASRIFPGLVNELGGLTLHLRDHDV